MPGITATPKFDYMLSSNSMPIAIRAFDIGGTTFVRAVVKILLWNPTALTETEISEEVSSVSSGSSTIYIQELFSDERLNISLGSSNAINLIAYKIRYQLIYIDSNGDEQETDWHDNDSAIYYVLPGGFSREYEAHLNESSDLFAIAGNRFLSNHPRIKKMRSIEYDYLSFIVTSSDIALYLEKNEKESLLYKPGATNINRVACIRISPIDISEPNFTILLKLGDKILDKREYHIFPSQSKTAHCFYFRNSFGTWDSASFYGKLSAKRALTGELFNAATLSRPSIKKPDIISERKSYNTTYTADIGYHSGKDYQDFITELAISEEVWLMENEVMIPVNITMKDYITRNEEGNNIYNAEITWQRAFSEKYFTKDYGAIVAPINPDNIIINSDGNAITDSDGAILLYI